MFASFISPDALTQIRSTVDAVLEAEQRAAEEQKLREEQEAAMKSPSHKATFVDAPELQVDFKKPAELGPNVSTAINTWWKLLRDRSDRVNVNDYCYFSKHLLDVLVDVDRKKMLDPILRTWWDQRVGANVSQCSKHHFNDLQYHILKYGFYNANPEEFVDDAQLTVMTKHIVTKAQRDGIELQGMFDQEVQQVLRRKARPTNLAAPKDHATNVVSRLQKAGFNDTSRKHPTASERESKSSTFRTKRDFSSEPETDNLVKDWLEYVAFPSEELDKSKRRSSQSPKQPTREKSGGLSRSGGRNVLRDTANTNRRRSSAISLKLEKQQAEPNPRTVISRRRSEFQAEQKIKTAAANAVIKLLKKTSLDYLREYNLTATSYQAMLKLILTELQRRSFLMLEWYSRVSKWKQLMQERTKALEELMKSSTRYDVPPMLEVFSQSVINITDPISAPMEDTSYKEIVDDNAGDKEGNILPDTEMIETDSSTSEEPFQGPEVNVVHHTGKIVLTSIFKRAFLPKPLPKVSNEDNDDDDVDVETDSNVSYDVNPPWREGRSHRIMKLTQPRLHPPRPWSTPYLLEINDVISMLK